MIELIIKGKQIKVCFNRIIWFGLVFLFFFIGFFLNEGGFLGYTGDYLTALYYSMTEDMHWKLGGFYTVGRFFRFVNFWGFESLEEWSVFLNILFFPIIYIYCRDVNKITIFRFVFLSGFIVFLSACVCNISKEVLQFLAFLSIERVIFSHKIQGKVTKITIILLVLICCGIFLRSYFFLTMLCFTFFSLIYLMKGRTRRTKLWQDILLFLFILYISMIIGNKLFPELYNEVVNARRELLYTYSNANTLIDNLIYLENEKLNWILNYVVNAIRILFPLEFLFHGLKYFLFVVVQVIFSLMIFGSYNQISEWTFENKAAYFVLLSFIIVELVWEVDLGTMFRHETAAFPLIISIFYKVRNIGGDGNI